MVAYPDNTDDAIASGVLGSQLGLIERFVRNFRIEHGDPLVVLAGGHAAQLAPHVGPGTSLSAPSCARRTWCCAGSTCALRTAGGGLRRGCRPVRPMKLVFLLLLLANLVLFGWQRGVFGSGARGRPRAERAARQIAPRRSAS
jgi:hypothetical protein